MGVKSGGWGDAQISVLGLCRDLMIIRETMHSALILYCTIKAQLISGTRGRASQPKVLAMATDCSHLSARIGAAQISIT